MSHHHVLRGLAGAIASAVLLGLQTAPAAADQGPACYALALRALTGPAGADLTLKVSTAEGCAAPDALKKVQLKTFDAAGQLADVRNLKDVAAPGGTANVQLGDVPRGRHLEAEVLVQTGDPERTYVLRDDATTLLRPNLTVTSVQAPAQTLTVRPVDVHAQIAEVNGDVDATASVTVAQGPTPLAPAQTVNVPAGGQVAVSFSGLALTTPVPVELTVRVSDVAPAETNADDNARSATVDVTENELARSRLLLDNLGGYGAQFNHHVFAKITPGPAGAPGLEPKVDALEPQLVRIFYNDASQNPVAFPDRYASFIDVVRMANETGASINITYQTTARAQDDIAGSMSKFADVFNDLVRTRGYTNVRWATIQNEPNRARFLTKDEYRDLYRALHNALVARGLREQVKLMVGDLVESDVNGNHRDWMAYITANMLDIVDAYSEHIYWQYWDTSRMDFRLKDVRKLMFEELPPEARRPVYLIEYGVRGHQLDKPGVLDSLGGYWENTTQIVRTNIAAFQQLWFNIEAAQLGFDGTAKWDAYWGKYDNGTQAFYMIGPEDEGWPLFPTYHALRMLFQTTARGWQILGVDPWGDDDWKLNDQNRPFDQLEKEIAAYAGPNGELTLLGLDSRGRDLNAVSTETPAYSVGGLPPATTFNLVIWNALGNGEDVISTPVTTNAAGVARFAVPLHGAFALTTVPVG
jgi:hypothetical protein